MLLFKVTAEYTNLNEENKNANPIKKKHLTLKLGRNKDSKY